MEKEKHFETLGNKSEIEKLESIIDNLNSNTLEPSDRAYLEVIRDKINNVIAGRSKTDSADIAEGHEDEGFDEDEEKLKALKSHIKIVISDAIDCFSSKINLLIEGFDDPDPDKRTDIVHDIYSTKSWLTPSGNFFTGDYRKITKGKLLKELGYAYSINKDEIMAQTEILLPNVAKKLKALFDEFDNWFKKRQLEVDSWKGIEPQGSEPTITVFKKMAQRIVNELNNIKKEL